MKTLGLLFLAPSLRILILQVRIYCMLRTNTTVNWTLLLCLLCDGRLLEQRWLRSPLRRPLLTTSVVAQLSTRGALLSLLTHCPHYHYHPFHSFIFLYTWLPLSLVLLNAHPARNIPSSVCIGTSQSIPRLTRLIRHLASQDTLTFTQVAPKPSPGMVQRQEDERTRFMHSLLWETGRRTCS